MILNFQVNNSSLVGADHHQAVSVLKEAGNNIRMEVSREALANSSNLNIQVNQINIIIVCENIAAQMLRQLINLLLFLYFLCTLRF